MFVDYGHKYLTPAKPKWTNPPSRYRKPEKPKRPKYVYPSKKWVRETRRAKPKGMVPKRLMKSFIPIIKPAIRQVARLNPYYRLVSYAWDAYDGYNASGDEWAVTKPAGYRLDEEGFVLCCESSPPPYAKVRRVGGPANSPANPPDPICTLQTACGVQLQVPTWDYGTILLPQVPAGGSGTYLVTYYFGIAQQNGARMRFDQKWQKLYARPGTYPDIPMKPARVAPMPMEHFAPYPELKPEPLDWPDLKREPPLMPYEVPAREYDPRGRGSWIPAKHQQLPPPKHVHEKKLVIIKKGPIASAAGGLFGATTEAMDLINSLYDALPEDRKIKGVPATQERKIRFVMRNLHAIDWAKAVENIAWDTIQDFGLAEIAQAANKPTVKNPYWVGPTGPTAGTRRWFHRV